MIAEPPNAPSENGRTMTAETAAESNIAANADAARTETERPIVFFDGVCGMCNHTVDFLLKHDRRQQLLFATLQGTTAKARLGPRDVASLSSIVFLAQGKAYRHSTAVTRILWRIGGVWRVLGAMLWLVPWPVRHLGYQLTAKLRYRLFGRKETCRMPTPAERARFLP